MPLSLDVYGPTNTGPSLGTLTKPRNTSFITDLRVPGALRLTADIAVAADQALLTAGNVIRVNDGVNDIEAFVIRDRPTDYLTEFEIPTRHPDVHHLLTWLGYERGGAVLHPYDSVNGLQQAPRWFGPMGFDYVEPTPTPPEPTTDGPLTRENWRDPRAERFVFNTRALYRRVLTGNPAWAGNPSRMWLTSAYWTNVRVWFDGTELPTLSSRVGDRTIRMFDITYDGLDHVIFFDCEGDPPAGAQNSLGWTWAVLSADASGEYNNWGNMVNRLFTTFNSTTYSGPTPPTAPFWQALEDYADGDYWGVTVGYVMKTAVEEAQARGLLLSVTMDFDEDLDSDGVAWEYLFARAFRVQRLGLLLNALSAWKCEPEMTPANVLRLHQFRGTDRTATVTVLNPRELVATGRGPMATRYLYETDGGFAIAIDSAAETALGYEMEEFIQLGEDTHPHTVVEAVDLQLAEDAAEQNVYEAVLPDNVVPYTHVFKGDLVTAQSDAAGTTDTMRVVGFTAIEGDIIGHYSWRVILEPWST